jgi:hypothetical protein
LACWTQITSLPLGSGVAVAGTAVAGTTVAGAAVGLGLPQALSTMLRTTISIKIFIRLFLPYIFFSFYEYESVGI